VFYVGKEGVKKKKENPFGEFVCGASPKGSAVGYTNVMLVYPLIQKNEISKR